jgi:hypothetical protein
MNATADSNTINKTKPVINNIRTGGLLEVAGDLIKVIKRCPATKLAANRTDKVMGRIRFLTNSISTIKGIRM